MTIRNLDALVNPRAVAVVGGSDRPGSLGALVLARLREGGFAAPIAAINPHPVRQDGVRWVRSIDALGSVPDLAIVATPPGSVEQIVAELGQAGCRVAVILSAGLESIDAQARLRAAAAATGLRLVGPNCLGVLAPHVGLNASFSPVGAAKGGLALISQSGALVTAMLDGAAQRGLGYSGLVSVGDMIDVDLGDLIDLFAADDRTTAILLYIEGVTQGRRFMSAARAAARVKPVAVLKAGRTAPAGAAAFSHTGAMTGSWAVYAAAFRRAGLLQVDGLEALFDTAVILTRYPRGSDSRYAVITNGGGAAVLAADALIEAGVALPPLSAATINLLDTQLPRSWSRRNPIDVIGDAEPARFSAALRAALAQEDIDGVLVIHCPTAVASGTAMATAVIETLEVSRTTKPVIGCWLGETDRAAVQPLFAARHLPLFGAIEHAAAAIGQLVALRRGPPQRATSARAAEPPDRARAAAIISEVQAQGRETLTAVEAKGVAAAYGIPVPVGRFVSDPAAIPQACPALLGPLAVKLISPDLSHKSDVGAVELNVPGVREARNVAEAMRKRVQRKHPEAQIAGFEIEPMIRFSHAQELLIGFTADPVFGPVISFGAGGTAAEIVDDIALALPPLDAASTDDLIGQTRISRLLHGYRNVPAVDFAGLHRVVRAVAALAADFPLLREFEINPLSVGITNVMALDVRAALLSEGVAAPLAIRPYPSRWEAHVVSRGGVSLTIRPVRTTDEAAVADLFRHVSDEDLYFRFLTALRQVPPRLITEMVDIDYDRRMHFLAFAGEQLIGSALLAGDDDHARAELALAVREGWKGKGVSWALVRHALRYAEAEGYRQIESIESAANAAALRLEREVGFVTETLPGDATEIHAVKHLRPKPAPSD